MNKLGDIAGVFAYLSLLTVGGGMAAFPELKTLTVDTYHWLTFPEMLHFYSLGQLAPGPNMMMVASIGAVVAGLPGALVALVAFFLPTGILTFVIGRIWSRLANWRWRPSIKRSRTPVTSNPPHACGSTSSSCTRPASMANGWPRRQGIRLAAGVLER